MTREPEIQVYQYSDLAAAAGDKANGRMVLQKKVSLLLETRVASRRQPVAVAAGYFELADNGAPRQMHIVVLTQGWDVICFDADLKVVWETSITKEIPEGSYIR